MAHGQALKQIFGGIEYFSKARLVATNNWVWWHGTPHLRQIIEFGGIAATNNEVWWKNESPKPRYLSQVNEMNPPNPDICRR